MSGARIGAVKTPWHLWVVGVSTLAFNAMGAFSYTITRLGKLADFGMKPDQIAFMESYPGWTMTVWALGVWGAFAGSLLLLLHSRVAAWAMMVAMIGLTGTTIYNYILVDMPASMQAPALDVTIWAVTLFLLFYTRRMTQAGVLR